MRCRGDLEREAHRLGYVRVAGIDEAGRGCLFGPVFAAAVILSEDKPVRGLRDSKQLTANQRENLAAGICASALAWAVGRAEAAEIDELNILQASRLAMRRAVEQLSPPPDYLLVDAVQVDSPLPQRSIIGGDARCFSIAAASILAKVSRDHCMQAFDNVYPQYGLKRHKGYPTPEHQRALAIYGPCPQHRLSFRPVREAALQRNLFAAGAGE